MAVGRTVRTTSCQKWSVGVLAGCLDDLAPTDHLGFDELAVAGWLEAPVVDDGQAQGFLPLDQLRILQGDAPRCVPLGKSRWRSATGSIEPVPHLHVEIRQTCFGKC